MTKDDYLRKHIPHRINLLITYRERYSNLQPDDRTYAGEIARDFLRCSKDISMMMVRFLLGELGINLVKGNSDISEKKHSPYVAKLNVEEVIRNSNYQNILDVLKAANRAVAHMEDLDVNHVIQNDQDDIILFNAISFTETMCINKMYEFNHYSYNEIMNEDGNNMHRDRLNLKK